jgi:hypothetical protein
MNFTSILHDESDPLLASGHASDDSLDDSGLLDSYSRTIAAVVNRVARAW